MPGCNLILNELVTGKRAEGGQRKKAIIIMTIKCGMLVNSFAA